ncbi:MULTISPECIES: hypothetical protein [Streptacidiphilus]|uniref:ATP-binding protein n=1 Tax=Streptacidiphilus cavernicola TaxID=3342716 RepID=A0ABV6UFP6_9ACTN|nr:hypothetical protein [Streptacidiphilus jeojiense]
MSPRAVPRLAVLPEALLWLGAAALCSEVALALVGGLPGAATGAAVLAVAGILAVRYVHGAQAMDSDYRRKVHLVGSREPTLRYWDAAIEDALDSMSGYELHLRPLLQRLYAVRLAERHGVSLDTQPRQAAAIIGPELWPWIDPTRPRTGRHPLDVGPLAPAAGNGAAGRQRRSTTRRVDPRLAPDPISGPVLTALVERLEKM